MKSTRCLNMKIFKKINRQMVQVTKNNFIIRTPQDNLTSMPFHKFWVLKTIFKTTSLRAKTTLWSLHFPLVNSKRQPVFHLRFCNRTSSRHKSDRIIEFYNTNKETRMMSISKPDRIHKHPGLNLKVKSHKPK